MRWAELVARTMETTGAYRVLVVVVVVVVGSQGKRSLRRLELDRGIILKWVFELKYNIKNI